MNLFSKKIAGIPVIFVGSIALGIMGVDALFGLLYYASKQPAFSPQTVISGDFTMLENEVKFYRSFDGELPSQSQGLTALIQRPADYQGKSWTQVIDKIPLDPWKHPYVYVRNDALPDGFGVYSNGPDGRSRTNGNDPDDVASWRER